MDFVVIDVNGIHPVTVQFCECSNLHHAGNTVQQLLRFELYPATISDPTTCFTFGVLEHFSMLTLQGKITAYDYYLSLQYMTDNLKLGTSYVSSRYLSCSHDSPANLSLPQNRLKAFMRVVRQWRHLKALKRAGRGHEPGGVMATKPGELCVKCPACPRPGFNLPDNWDSISDELKYVPSA